LAQDRGRKKSNPTRKKQPMKTQLKETQLKTTHPKPLPKGGVLITFIVLFSKGGVLITSIIVFMRWVLISVIELSPGEGFKAHKEFLTIVRACPIILFIARFVRLFITLS
jgi:hypothetical protein